MVYLFQVLIVLFEQMIDLSRQFTDLSFLRFHQSLKALHVLNIG